jgi:light-independent protochlorophyllide reductase subunit N
MTAWLEAAADAWSCQPRPFRSRVAWRPQDARAEQALARHRERLGGKRIFLFPDSQLEDPAGALSVARTRHAKLVEVGTPYLHAQHLGRELALLPEGTTSSEGQDVDASSTAAARHGPTSSSAASASPTRWRPRA